MVRKPAIKQVHGTDTASIEELPEQFQLIPKLSISDIGYVEEGRLPVEGGTEISMQKGSASFGAFQLSWNTRERFGHIERFGQYPIWLNCYHFSPRKDGLPMSAVLYVPFEALLYRDKKKPFEIDILCVLGTYDINDLKAGDKEHPFDRVYEKASKKALERSSQIWVDGKLAITRESNVCTIEGNWGNSLVFMDIDNGSFEFIYFVLDDAIEEELMQLSSGERKNKMETEAPNIEVDQDLEDSFFQAVRADVGQKAEAAREEAQVSKRQLAKRMKTEPGQIRRIESGSNSTGLDMLAKFADKIGYKLDVRFLPKDPS